MGPQATYKEAAIRFSTVPNLFVTQMLFVTVLKHKPCAQRPPIYSWMSPIENEHKVGKGRQRAERTAIPVTKHMCEQHIVFDETGFVALTADAC